jgi:hypothetical protein
MKAVTRLHERLDGWVTGGVGLMAQECGRYHPPPRYSPKTQNEPKKYFRINTTCQKRTQNEPKRTQSWRAALAEVLQNQRCFERPPGTNPKRTQEVMRLAVCLNCLQKCGLHAISAKTRRPSGSSRPTGRQKARRVYVVCLSV